MLYAARVMLMRRPKLMMEAPEDYKKLVPDMGSTTWCSTTHLNTSKLALLFHKTPGIKLVAQEFAE